MNNCYVRLMAALIVGCLAGNNYAQNLSITSTVFPIQCNGACNGVIDINVTGGAPAYSFDWSNGATIQDLSNICAGIYTVTVTDANGTTRTASATVTQPAPLSLVACATDVSCFGSSNGSIDLTVSGGTSPYQYFWSNGNTTQDLTNLAAGTYIPTVFDANGCTAVSSATVNQPTQISISSTVTNAGINGNTGAIDISVTGGTPAYTYNWSNGSTAQDLFNLSAGTYTVTVIDANGCTRSQSMSVTQSAGGGGQNITINETVTNSSCAGCSGAISVSVSNGGPTGNFTYLWSNSTTTSTITQLCPGTYCVSVTGPNGVLQTECYTVLQGQSQNIPIKSTNAAFCNYNISSSTTCEKVCPGATITYLIEPPLDCGQPVQIPHPVWTVTGASEYTVSPDGLQVTVTWGDPGAGQITVASNSPNLCFESQFCVTIVEEPVAQFSTQPAATGNSLQICKGQSVTFKNESLNADQYEWTFSDQQSVVTSENTQHTFNTPGNFTVTLIARSNCLCADTTVLLVEVLDTEPPMLDCVGSVCPGETVTYSTSDNCGAYTWVVSPNGTVIDGGGPSDASITIQWGQGPQGVISLSVSGCSGAACPQASIFTVPIISDNAEIRGREFVCKDNEETYSIDLFDGAEYTWTLSSGGSILEGQGTNEVVVAWTGPANANTTHWLIVDYFNCYLGCGGTDSIPVKILPPFFVQGAVELCEKASATFTSKLTTPATNLNVNWFIYREDGSLFWNSTVPASVLNFPPTATPGKYRIVAEPATPGQTCLDMAELRVSVVAAPPKPAAIEGPTVICPGNPYSYEMLGSAPYSVEWKANNGSPATQIGDPVTVIWNTNANRWISALHVSVDGLNCKSDTIRMLVSAPAAMSITGVPAACEGTVAYYETEDYDRFEYFWEILPADAGTIKSGQGSSAIEIYWQTPGNHQVRATTCGASTTFNVVVWSNPEPQVLAPDGLCPGAQGMASTAVSYASYAWQTANGNLLSAAANVDLEAGAYALEVTDVNGCQGNTSFTIDVLPKPNATVTTADPTGFCNNSLFVSITALTPDNGTYTYAWTHDGAPVGANNPVHINNQYGWYTVVVTNEFGCTATAPPILLFEYCGDGYCSGNGNPLCPPGSVQLIPDPTPRCDSIALVLNDYTGQYVQGSAAWYTFISGGDMIATASGDGASFIYPNAGKYIVLVEVTFQNGDVCEVIDSVDIEAVAQFSYQPDCPGDTTLFSDESSRLPEYDIVGWAWDFGEVGSTDVSVENSPGYPYVASGSFTATLTVTSATGCKSTATEIIPIPQVPSAAFTPPLANCAGNAAEFLTGQNSGISDVQWVFGDPASGALNTGGSSPAYHQYAPAGNYNVTLQVSNAYGCEASLTQTISIVDNPFAGNIFPPNPTICEDKTVTLFAPSGPGAQYVWTNGANLQTFEVSEEGVYDVTLTNGNGCSYSPPAVTVEVNPAPAGVIKALDINELGQVIGVTYNSLSVCAGEDVNLQVQDNGSYTYQWSGGNGTTEVLIFSEDRGNLLTVGTHMFTVTVTNPATGCTAVFAPFEVTVNPVPSGFSISTDNVCAGLPSNLSYTGPQPAGWQLLWNNGEMGPGFSTTLAGQYFVRVVNEFGCSAQSNEVVIFPGPNVSAIPSGCHERCNPDTLCLPAMPDIVSWQWFFENAVIPGANTQQFAATQSGTYYAEMVDIHGCPARSADLTVELYDGFGNVLGQVWSDVNNNGIVDAADTLVASIPVQLLQNGTVVNSSASDATGSFQWQNVFATGYSIQLDTANLSPLWEVVILSDSVSLTGCGGKVFADLLVDAYLCPPISSSVALSACPGTAVDFDGFQIMAGESMDITYTAALGCDSVVTVSVAALPVSSGALNVSVCPGSTYNFQGVDLNVGQTQNFTLTNYLGCDSVVTVNVSALPVSSGALNVSVCPGTPYTFQGVDLNIGQTQNFTLVNYLGCDSVVTVSVSALPVSTGALNVSVCPGTPYNFQGVDLTVGQSQNFTLTNYLGCDSVVTVSVSALPVSTGALNVSVCPGSTYTYEGVDLAVGQTQNFTLTNYLGCDSIVTVSVSALPVPSSSFQAQVCPGATFSYEGVALSVGQTQSFTLTTPAGCDSIVTVNVSALPVSTGALQAQVCPGEVFSYQGVNLVAGQTQDFTLTNYLGCDSIVTVTVSALATSSGAMSVGVCPGETYTYQGIALAAGTVQDFVLSNSVGCDSVLTLTVYEKASSAEIREVMVCPGETYAYQGMELEAGQVETIHFTNGEGCDSVITISVLAWPEPDFFVQPQASCPNTGTGSLEITVMPGGPVVNGYSINGVDFQTNAAFVELAAGNYTVTLRDENGCFTENPATIAATPPLTLELAPSLLIPCDSAGITLRPALGGDTLGIAFSWWNGATTPSVSVSEAGPVAVAAINHCNQRVEAAAQVDWADWEGNPINIYVPNIFAPNAKNADNTIFRAFVGNNFSLLTYRMEVYDRWGNMLFETELPETGWEGAFRDKIMEPGVYVWQLWAKVAFCGRELELYKKGDVTVQR